MSYPPGYFGFGQQVNNPSLNQTNPFGIAGMQMPKMNALSSSLFPQSNVPQGTIMGAAPERVENTSMPPMDLGMTDAQMLLKKGKQAAGRAADSMNKSLPISLGDRTPAAPSPLGVGSTVADAEESSGMFANMSPMDIGGTAANMAISMLPGKEGNNQWGVTKTTSNIALNPATLAATGGLSALAVPIAFGVDLLAGQDNLGKAANANQDRGEARWDAQKDNTPYDGNGYRQGASGWFQNTNGFMAAAEGGPIKKPELTSVTPHAAVPKLNYMRLEAPTTPNIQRANTLLKEKGIVEPRMANGGESDAGHVIPVEKVEEARLHAKRAGIAKLVDRPAFMSGEEQGGIIPGDGAPKADDKFFRPAGGESIKISSGEMYVSAENFAKMALAAGMDQDEYAQHMYPNSQHTQERAFDEGGPVAKLVPEKYRSAWGASLKKYNLEEHSDVLYNMVQKESSWRADVDGPIVPGQGTAKGLFQFMDRTAKEFGMTNSYDPVQNIDAGMRYFRQNLNEFKDPALAVAAHISGAGSVRRAKNRVPNTAEPDIKMPDGSIRKGTTTVDYVNAITAGAGTKPAEKPAKQPASDTTITALTAPIAPTQKRVQQPVVDPDTFQPSIQRPQSSTDMNDATNRLQALHSKMFGRADGGPIKEYGDGGFTGLPTDPPVSNARTPFAGMSASQIQEAYRKSKSILDQYKGFDMNRGSVYHGPEIDKQYHDARMMQNWLAHPTRTADVNDLNVFGLDVSLPAPPQSSPISGATPSRFDWGLPSAQRAPLVEDPNTANTDGGANSNGSAGEGGGNTPIAPPAEEQTLPPPSAKKTMRSIGDPPQMDWSGIQKMYDQSALYQVAPVVASGVYNALSKPTLMPSPDGLRGEFVDLGTDAMRVDLNNRRSVALNTAVMNNRGNQNPAIGLGLAADYQQAGIQDAAIIQRVQNEEAAINNNTANRVNEINWQAKRTVEQQNAQLTAEHRARKGIAISEAATNLGRIGASAAVNKAMFKTAASDRENSDYWRKAYMINNIQLPL